MTQADISGLMYFLPLFSFLFVFVIIYAILTKTKVLGENNFANIFVSFVIAIVFATTAGTREYIETVTPWVVVLAICMFFILLVIGLSQQKIDAIMKPGFVWVFIILVLVIFLFAASNVFSSVMTPFWQNVQNTISTQEKLVGGIGLLVIGALAAWVLTKK
jgi:hypothetical protein